MKVHFAYQDKYLKIAPKLTNFREEKSPKQGKYDWGTPMVLLNDGSKNYTINFSDSPLAQIIAHL